VPSDSAEYEGTVIFDPNLTSKLPIFQIFINPNSTNWIKPFPSGLPNVGVDSQTGGRMSLFYNGDLYDNIDMAVRGNTTAGYPKNSHHVNFHPDKPLKHPGPGGAIFHTSFLSETADPAFLRTYLSFWLLDLMGVPSPFDYPVRFQLNSQYYGLYFHNDTLGPEQLKRLGYDPSGALYKAAGQIVPSYSSTGGFEKRTRLYEGRQDYDALAYGINEARPAGVRKTNIFDMLNLPEIVNYLAVARWNCEGDDVWANMTLYRDTENTREWFIIPFDLNVSWGQLYCGDVSSAFGSVIATNDNYKSHPFYGGSQVQQNHSANWNRIYDVIVATPETRQMLQRRERTLMDKFVQPPGTTVAQGIMEQQIVYMTNLMWTEMFLDRQKWQWPCSSVCGMYCWGPGGNTGTLPAPWPTNTDFGAPGLINEYIVPRRTHWFVTHSITNTARSIGLDNTNNAGLPLAQPANAFITVAGLEANPASGIQAQEYICLTNPTPFALDISGWKLNGAFDFTFKPGTVMPSNSVLYVSPDVAAFRARGTGPSGGQGLFVVGPYKGQLSARGETISIVDDTGRSVSRYSYPDASSAVQQFLRITELMYHPEPLSGNPNGPEEFEYIELKNISTNVTLDLTGVRLINGVDFNFTGSAVTSLASGQRVLIVKDLAAFTARYGSLPNVAGQYGGYLDNGGERIQLVDAKGEEVLDFSYNNSWYPITDGLGFSLVVVDEQAMPDAWDSKVNWRASGAVSGSPGGVDPAPPAFSPVVINEALPRTDLPPPTDSIELFNPSASSADISGLFLSNDFFTPKKYRLPAGTILAAGTYRVFDESQFNPQPGVDPSFSLNGLGGEVYLFSANAGGDLTGYYHGFSFGAAENGVSFGRYVSSDGKEQFVGQAALSLGTNNPPPKVGPVVINEIMYHPPEIGGTNDNTVDEFLELLNISNSTVSLFDGAQPWKIAGGIDFALPLGVTLASGQTLLVVNFNPTNTVMLAAFQAKYGVGAGVQVFGPYDGKLNNNGDEVRLIKPTTQLGGTIPFVLVDRVEYSDSAPWPAGADGFGLSLQRKTATAFGNDPANWLAALPSAAAATSASGTAPAITAQSPSQAAVAGTNLILSVSATGDAPRRYQWRYNGADLTDATNATLQLSGIQQQNAGDYKVVVFNNAGSAVSSNMTISILLPASILVHPQGVTAFPLSSASFNVLAFSTTPLRYQWRFNGTDIQAATNATFTIASVQPANDGQYSVAVTDAVGTGVSDAAHLTVLLHPVFTQQPTNRTIFLGTNVTNITFSAASSSTTPVTYQWHFNGATVPGVTGGSFTISNAQVQAGGDFPV